MAMIAPDRVMPPVIGYSHSQTETFHSCQRCWAYEKILKVKTEEDTRALVYGNAVHEGLALLGRGQSLQDATTVGMNYLHEHKNELGKDFDKYCEWLPLNLEGFFTHYFPKFLQQWEIVETERYVEYAPMPGYLWRGYLDVIARHRQTGAYGVFDYKTSSKQYIDSLKPSIRWNHQLADYLMAFYRNVVQQWPASIGLIFLRKPAYRESPQKFLSPDMYLDISIEVDPTFIQFAIDVEKNDAVGIGMTMYQYYQAYSQQGLAALDTIPANFASCFKYGRKCGYADGCHSGRPLHTIMKDAL